MHRVHAPVITTFEGSVRGNRLERAGRVSYGPGMKNPFRYFKTSPEIIRLAVIMYVRFPLSLRQVDVLLIHGVVFPMCQSNALRSESTSCIRQPSGSRRLMFVRPVSLTSLGGPLKAIFVSLRASCAASTLSTRKAIWLTPITSSPVA